MCKRDTGSVKVAPESVLINMGTHVTRFSPGGGGVISVHPYPERRPLAYFFINIRQGLNLQPC